MKIYTRFGDKGQTRLPGGHVVAKNDLRVIACGDLDELNSAIGAAVAVTTHPGIAEQLDSIQQLLLESGAVLAGVSGSENNSPRTGCVREADVRFLETSIDEMSEQLPELRQFILPGGSPSSAALHMARTICRRAERSVVAAGLSGAGQEQLAVVMQYLNRLADWLFVAARFANQQDQGDERVWLPRSGHQG